MKTLDEILKEQKITKYQSYFKNAMKQAQLEILEELKQRYLSAEYERSHITNIIEELKEELK